MPPRPRLFRARRLGLCVVALAAALGGCHRAPAKPAQTVMFVDDHGRITVPAGSPLRARLGVAPVIAGAPVTTLALPGTIMADPARVVAILTPLTGRVVALKVGLGTRVTEGQVLAVLASGDLAEAYADRDKARDAAKLTAEALRRALGVQAAGGAATKDTEAARSADNQARAELVRAEARLAALIGRARNPDHQLVLRAPCAGVITALATAVGAQVTDPTASLMTLTNTDQVLLNAELAENDLGTIPPGAKAAIGFVAYPGQVWHGRVASLDPAVSVDTRREAIHIPLANADGRLLPGMFGTARIIIPAPRGVFVPQSALLMNNDTITVLVEIKPFVFRRRMVTLGDETPTTARVLSGLAPGERIVVRGGVLLND